MRSQSCCLQSSPKIASSISPLTWPSPRKPALLPKLEQNFQYRPPPPLKSDKNDIRNVLGEWEAEFMKEQELHLLERTRRKQTNPQSSLTELAMKTKRQRELLRGLEEEDNYEKFASLRDLDNPELQTQFFEESIAELEDDNMRPGDLIDYAAHGDLAIFIKTTSNGHGGVLIQLLTQSGEYVEQLRQKTAFSVPGFLDPKELDPILPYFPTDGEVTMSPAGMIDFAENVPRHLSAPITAKIAAFQRASAEVYRKHSKSLDECMEILGSANKPWSLTLTHATRLILRLKQEEDVKPEELWAVDQALSCVEVGAVRDNAYLTNRTWHFLKAKEISLVKRVSDWWHEYQSWKMASTENERESITKKFAKASRLRASKSRTDPRLFQSFIHVARGLVLRNRRINRCLDQPAWLTSEKDEATRDATVRNEPSYDLPKVGDNYDKAHSDILRLILLTAQRSIKNYSEAAAISALIVRDTGLYEGVTDHRFSIKLFLQELGVLSPWEIKCLAAKSRMIPGHDISGSSDKALAKATATVDQGVETFVDRMADLRSDWGDLDVYCVDDTETTLIDDGFSVERIDGDDTQVWVHIHAANPTAFIKKNHPITKFAARLGSSLFFADGMLAMIDSRLTSQLASLESGRACLTFSARLDSQGNILETRIASSRIHKVHFITPSTLKQVTLVREDEKPRNDSVPLSEGSRKSHALKSLDDLSSKQMDDLRLWHKFAMARVQKRTPVENAMLFREWSFQRLRTKVEEAPKIMPDWEKVRQFSEKPQIRLVQNRRYTSIPLHLEEVDLVAEAMLLSGTVAASWCAQRGLPVPYCVTTTREGNMSVKEFYETYVEPLAVQKHPIPKKLQWITKYLGQTEYSIAPAKNVIVGADAYLKVTSPLRRFYDMLAHYQIEGALRYEKALEATAPRRESLFIPDSGLPFTAEEMSNELKLQAQLSLKRRFMEKEDETDWQLRYMHRALYYGEGVLPETVYVMARTDPTRSEHLQVQFRYRLLNLVTQCFVDDFGDIREEDMEDADVFYAKIIGVDLVARCLRVKLLKPVDKASQLIPPHEYEPLLEWAQSR